MKINDDHKYHGAALTQIAENQQFTAINAFKVKSVVSRSAFRVNDDIGVYLKYSSKPKGTFMEYVFTFNDENIAELELLADASSSVHLALVCVEAREICCLPYGEFTDMVEERKQEKGAPEAQYSLLVTCPKGKSFRVYMNAPGTRKKSLSQLTVPRNRFPDGIFG